MLEVYVPATSANIGPGYDCLGLCLDLFNKFTFEELESGLQFEGCDEAFAGVGYWFRISRQPVPPQRRRR